VLDKYFKKSVKPAFDKTKRNQPWRVAEDVDSWVLKQRQPEVTTGVASDHTWPNRRAKHPNGRTAAYPLNPNGVTTISLLEI
jgi:hypothetical protein